MGQVTRCICYDRSFSEIKAYAREHNIKSVKTLQKQDYCSNSCRLCTPYVALVLKTGETSFDPGAYKKRR